MTIWLRYYLPNLLIFEPDKLRLYGRPPQTTQSKTKTNRKGWLVFLVGAGGVEPPQSKTTDLQSAPALRLRRAPETLFVRLCHFVKISWRKHQGYGVTLDFCNRVLLHAITKTRGASRGNRTLISSLEGLHSSL